MTVIIYHTLGLSDSHRIITDKVGNMLNTEINENKLNSVEKDFS